MPNFHAIIENWRLAVWSFLIIAAAILIFWGIMYIFNQHHRMKPPRARVIIAGCAFIGFLFSWFFLTELANASSELKDIRMAAIGRENRGLWADILLAGPIDSHPTLTLTNYTLTLQSMSSSPQNRTLQSGFDMAFVLRIFNAGPPTTAWNYKAYIVLPGRDKKEIDALIPSVGIPRSGEIATIQTAVGPYSLTADKFLINALSFKPMATGAAGNYWLILHVNGLSQIPPGTLFVISFQDVFGRTIKALDTWSPPQ